MFRTSKSLIPTCPTLNLRSLSHLNLNSVKFYKLGEGLWAKVVCPSSPSKL